MDKKTYNISFDIELDENDLAVLNTSYNYDCTVQEQDVFGCGCCRDEKLSDVQSEILYGVILRLNEIVEKETKITRRGGRAV